MPPENTPIQPTTIPTGSVEPTGAPEQPAPEQTPVTPPASGKRKWPLVAAIVVAVLVIGGVVTYFLVLKEPVKQASVKTTSDSSTTENAANMDTVDTDSVDTRQGASTVTSVTTTDSPNHAYGNGTVSFTHPTGWKVTREVDKYDSKNTFITSPMGNAVKMYRRDSVGGTCGDNPNNDARTYTLVKRLTTQNSAYIFSEYKTPAGWGTGEALSLEPNFDQAKAAHKALAEGQSGTGLCQNLFYYPIAKDINVTILNKSGKEATYNDIKDDTAFIAMLQSFDVTDN